MSETKRAYNKHRYNCSLCGRFTYGPPGGDDVEAICEDCTFDADEVGEHPNGCTCEECWNGPISEVIR